MHIKLGFFRRRSALLPIFVAGLVISVWGLYPRAANAQGGGLKPDRVYSTGAFQLQDGERILIGLLLPAIHRAKADASFHLMNGQGARLYNSVLNPPQTSSSFFDVFFDITYHAESPTNPNGGVFEIRSKGAPGGGDLVTVPSPDGILIGLLLPAVQQGGKTASPLSTSMQSFHSAEMGGGTMTHSFFDVFFDVF